MPLNLPAFWSTLKAWVRRGWWLAPPLLVGAAALAGWLIPTNQFLVLPGEAVNAGKLVSLSPPTPGNGSTPGRLLLVTVYSAPANVDEWLFAHVYPHAKLVPAHTQIPPNTSFNAFQREEARMMTDSQTAARVVAFQQLGYTVTLHGQGAIVLQVVPGSPAAAAGLPRGDDVIALDGAPTHTAAELAQQLSQHRPGDTVTLTVSGPHAAARGLKVTLGQRPNAAGTAFLGVGLGTDHPTYTFPKDVRIDAQGIIGPSGGLVLALQIIQALSPGDITHGKVIAATGTIGLDGQVGPIGDVQEKAVAVEGKAQYFLVPTANAAAVEQQAGSGLRIVPVSTIGQALAFLKTLG
ncbi:MAG: YlbL family protein [Chloroflexota bacterium]